MPSSVLLYPLSLHDALPIYSSHGPITAPTVIMKTRRQFSPGRFWAIVVKEFVQMRRDRLTFGMMIGIPLIQLVLFGFAINSDPRSEEHTSELQSLRHLVCRLPSFSTLFPYTTLFRSIHLMDQSQHRLSS